MREVSAMNQQPINDNALEPTVRVLSQLSPSSQEAVIALVRQLADREGISVALAASPGLQAQKGANGAKTAYSSPTNPDSAREKGARSGKTGRRLP